MMLVSLSETRMEANFDFPMDCLGEMEVTPR